MRIIVISILSFLMALSSCSRKTTPAETQQPTPAAQPASNTNRPIESEKNNPILGEKQVESQKMEIDPDKMEQIRKALQNYQQLQIVDPNTKNPATPAEKKQP